MTRTAAPANMPPETWDIGPLVNGKHQVITPGGEPWLARVVAECASIDDARKVRAAPELLAAAKRALNVLKAQGEAVLPGNALGALDVAIRKAEGRS